MADPNKIAEKIAEKAAKVLEPLLIEMVLAKWPPEFRKIVWDAVAHHATILANESR